MNQIPQAGEIYQHFKGKALSDRDAGNPHGDRWNSL